MVVIAAFVMGGMSNPLYGLLLAYVNDYLDVEDMAAASGGLLFANGVGAVLGPILTGYMLTTMGPRGFWIYLSIFMALIAAYALYRMTQRASVYQEEDDYDATTYAAVFPTSTAVAIEAASEYYAENAETDENAETEKEDGPETP